MKQQTTVFGNARFQIITSRLLRLEYAGQGGFIDEPTLMVSGRPEKQTPVEISEDQRKLEISTPHLKLTYVDDGRPFHADNLKIRYAFKQGWKTWHPGMQDDKNLKGTVATLDQADGQMLRLPKKNPRYQPGAKGTAGQEWIMGTEPLELPDGLISRSGCVCIADETPILDKDTQWVQPRPEQHACDWYVLAYGLEYREALRDAAGVFGEQPLPPRYVFGNWWSRYWAYTDQEMHELADQFDTMDVPLDVMVVDMDWHLEGWTGYTWDRRYFPDPDEFLKSLKERDLKITLNLHPADGVGAHEAAFPAMKKELKIRGKVDRIPFDVADKHYMDAYFKHLHHPEEKRGVDFWWMDWQQGEQSAMHGLRPLPWLNQLHWEDMEKNPERQGMRPLIFSRFGGIGAGRYCIGFSGDTYSSWESLAFQPYFTATAANVLYGYWSHDIGGHQPGEIEPELYTRWIQYSLFSPVIRTHTTKNPIAERRVWEYPAPYSHVMMNVLRERYEWVPYIYTECRKACETGVSLCHPLYYNWPDKPQSYKAGHLYCFGDKVIAAPVTSPLSEDDRQAEVHTWLPEGDWLDTARGEPVKGDHWEWRRYLLEEIPVFVKPGTIIPRQEPCRRLNMGSYDNLVLHIWPGEEGAYDLYEDDGQTVGYQQDKAAWLPLKYKQLTSGHRVTVGPVSGSYAGYKKKKRISIKMHMMAPPEKVMLGKQALDWTYDAYEEALSVDLGTVDVSKKATLRIVPDAAAEKWAGQGLKGLLARLSHIHDLVTATTQCHIMHENERITAEMYQAGNRINRNPATYTAEVRKLQRQIPELKKVLRHLHRTQSDDRKERYEICLSLLKDPIFKD